MERPVSSRGFSLLELAIVIIIIAIITGISLKMGEGALESARRAQTQNKMQLIEEALLAFRRDNQRLPCPGDASLSEDDANHGIEAANWGSCVGGAPAANFSSASVIEGSVPFRTLNLPETFMYDGWGRKFVYAVDANATDYRAFQTIGLSDSCGIAVEDEAGGDRTMGAVYALVSFGSVGHGAYQQNGTRYNGGSTNTDERLNCHCGSNGADTGYTATYVQRSRTENAVNVGDRFTHYVTYKERWQLHTYDDDNTEKLYRGPHLIAGFSLGSGQPNSAYTYQLQCGRLAKQADLNPVATEQARAVFFLPNNTGLLVFSEEGCVVYPIEDDGTVGAGDDAAVENCPAYDTNMIASMSDDGYLVLSRGVSPYVSLWKQSPGLNTFDEIVGGITGTLPASRPTAVSITSHFLLLTNASYSDILLYVRKANNSFGFHADEPFAGAVSSGLSPNQQYIGTTRNAEFQPWEISTTFYTPTASTLQSVTGNTDPLGLRFSGDSQYVAFGGNAGDNMVVFKILDDTITPSYVQLPAPTGWTSDPTTAGTRFAFSPDALYIAMTTPDTTNPLVLFRQTSPTTYRFAGYPDVVPAAAGISVDFYH